MYERGKSPLKHVECSHKEELNEESREYAGAGVVTVEEDIEENNEV